VFVCTHHTDLVCINASVTSNSNDVITPLTDCLWRHQQQRMRPERYGYSY